MPAITLFSTQVPGSCLHQLASMLDADERSRLQRLRQVADQRRYIVAHAGLRALLAYRLGVAAQSLRFVRNEHGKPGLADADAHGLHFNLSHAAELIAIAIADRPVGIDIEHQDAVIDPSMADLAFTDDEQRRCRSNADRLQVWTAKEAVIKACGRGMSLPLLNFAVTPKSNSFQVITLCSPEPGLAGQMVANFETLPGYYGAVSIKGPPQPILVETRDASKAIT